MATHTLPDTIGIQIQSEDAEAVIIEKRIGERIKALRLKKSMGLVELGRRTGLSASFLSQLETGRVVPTVRNLARIAMVFSKELNYFFEAESRKTFRIHRGKERVHRPETGIEQPAYYLQSLGYMVPDRALDPYFAEFVPGVIGGKAHQHPGCEFLYLMQGTMSIQHGADVYQIEPNDAVYFDARVSHSYACLGTTSASALIVTMAAPPTQYLSLRSKAPSVTTQASIAPAS
jgi:transcriptional regulator with XRE-family HTH domain